MKTAKRTIKGKQYNVQLGLSNAIRNCGNNCYAQVNLDKSTNEIWGDFHWSIGFNSWIRYHDNDIVVLGNFNSKNFKLSDLPIDKLY